MQNRYCMEFKEGDIVKNIYPIHHRVVSDTYMVDTPAKTAIRGTGYEPEEWGQYENVTIPPDTVWRVERVKLYPRTTEIAQQLCGMPHSADRVIVTPIKPIDELERGWLEQPALLFRPTTARS